MDEMHVDGCRLVPANTEELLHLSLSLVRERYDAWKRARRCVGRPFSDDAWEAYNIACEFREACSIALARDKPDAAVEGGRCPKCLAEIIGIWRELGYEAEVAREEAIEACEVLELSPARKAEPESGLAACEACLWCSRCGSEWEV